MARASGRWVGIGRVARSAAAAVAVAVLAAGCAAASSSADPADVVTVTGDPATVAVVDNAFEPAHVAISAGTTVTWEWEGSDEHNVVGGADLSSPTQREGTYEQRFDDPGTYEYRCTLHPGMTGSVTVLGPTPSP